ncbi:MAG: MBL fold metallo-hydrolase [Rhizobiaceae bacterium]|nr:MBL fold metallo-hydrolase [Rhizobiaceae bacterium]
MISDKLNRRNFLLASAAVAATSGLGVSRASSRTVYELGHRKISSLSDGNLVLPVSFLLPDVPGDELEPFLKAHGMSSEAFRPECNLTLVQDGERTILFDAGAGANFMPTAGKLPDQLSESGIDPASVTDVIFTHGHPDHLWGILDDFDEIAFPDAQLHFPQVEWDFWRADDTISKMSEARKVFAVGAQTRLAAMEENVSLFKPGGEILDGIEAVDTPGHTPGHTSFVVHGGSEGVMILGDAITNHVISFQKPDWPSGSDQDAQMGIKTRLALLDRLAGDKMAVIGYHLPNGGAGRVERDKSVYRFVGDS